MGISVPFELCRIRARKRFADCLLLIGQRLERRLVPRYIEILVEIVENEVQELLSILLFVRDPLRIETTACSLIPVSAGPEVAKQMKALL